MTIEQETLLKLIRVALGTEKNLSFPKNVNWQRVIDLSYEQGISAIAADGFQALVEFDPDNCPDIDGTDLEIPLYSWIGDSISKEKRYYEYKEHLAELVSFYNKHDIKVMILKGYGLSLLYPIPEHRATGDIDVYLFGKQEGADRLITKELGINVEDISEHHTEFHFKGEFVENHYDIVNTKVAKSAKWIEAKLKSLATDVENKGNNKITINGNEAYLPSDVLNAIFLIRHLGQHFSGEVSSLRQLLDWTLFVESSFGRFYNKTIRNNNETKQGQLNNQQWEDEIIPFLKEMGIYEFFCNINYICSYCYGINLLQNEIVTSLTPLQQRMLNDIFTPEFYGKDNEHRKNIFTLFIFRVKRYFTNGWKRRMVYKETVLGAFITNAKNRIIRLFKGKERIR